jgi:hypothetical protein
LAAAIHLGYLPPRVGTEEELRILRRQFLPFVQGLKSAVAVGILHHMGEGKKGEDVFILATGKKTDLLLKTLTNILPLLGEDPLHYHFINCQTYMIQKAQTDLDPCGWYNQIGQMVRQVQKGL